MKRLSTSAMIAIVTLAIVFLRTQNRLAAAELSGDLTGSVSSSGGDLANAVALGGVTFVENEGQFDSEVRFVAKAAGVRYWICNDRLVFQFSRGEAAAASHENFDLGVPPNSGAGMQSMSIQIEFVGASTPLLSQGIEKLEYYTNYLRGSDRSKWRTMVPNYSEVLIPEVWPGIDIHFYGNGDKVEYDFVVGPGVDPSLIRLRAVGASKLHLSSDGDLVMSTLWGDVSEKIPSVFQTIERVDQAVRASYVLLDEYSYGFSIQGEVDATVALVIDPQFNYSTYLGGSGEEFNQTLLAIDAIAVDNSGRAYVTGNTASSDFPKVAAVDSTLSDVDVFVTRFSADGKTLSYSTYIGSDGSDYGLAISVDAQNRAAFGGYVGYPSILPSAPKGFDQTINSTYGGFIGQLSANGDSLLYYSLLEGTGGYAAVQEVEYISGNDIVVGGYFGNTGNGYPVKNAYDSTHNGSFDAIVAEFDLDSTGANSLVYSTFIGGSDQDYVWGLDVFDDRLICVSGPTFSSNFPTQGGYDTSFNGVEDAWVGILNPAASGSAQLVFSTFLGGSSEDHMWEVAVDSDSNLYVVGTTFSSNFPTVNAYDTSLSGDRDAFVAKLNPWLSGSSQLLYSTYLGGHTVDRGLGMALTSDKKVWVTGRTDSSGVTAVGTPYHDGSWNGGRDAYMAKLDPSLSGSSSLLYYSYFGGVNNEQALAVALDGSDNPYFVGEAANSGLPVYNAFDSTYNGSNDAWVAKMCTPSTSYIPGDVNADGMINISDAIYIVNYLAGRVGAPNPLNRADVNCDGTVTTDDATYISNYIFGGPAPCAPDCQ